MKFKLVLFNIDDFFSKSRFSSLGLAYIAAYLKKYSEFKDISIIEGDGIAKLRKINPDAVGIYSVTQSFNNACRIAKSIKDEYRNICLVLGGYHITALPFSLPEVFDIGVLGEGEETMRELMEVFATYGKNPDKLSLVKGIAFHAQNDSKVKVTPPREFIQDMDSIPFPARDLLVNNRFLSIITSRGCPYKCIFCSSVNFWKKPRFHSPEYVVNEIEELIIRYKAVHISIWDDLFVANRLRLETISDLIYKKRINRKVSFGCALRSNLISPELCHLLKKMNVRRVSIGFESGSQRILDLLKCGSVTVKDHIKAVELCKSYGFYVTGTFMIGNPEETEEDLDKTLELIKRLKLTGGGNISVAAPLPGTAFWEYAKERNLVSDNMDYSRIGLMSADFTDPQGFRGVLLSDKATKERIFQIAQQMQSESNKHYLRGLLHRSNFSFRSIRFIIAKPQEVLSIMKFIIKSLLRMAPIMDRYVFYYKKIE